MIDVKLSDAETMNWLQWSASIVASLAWPVAAVAIAFIFRGQIRGLLASIRRLTWGDKSVDFAEKLDRIEEAVRVEGPSRSKPPNWSPLLGDDRFQALLAISPAAAILDAWGPAEMLIDELTDYIEPAPVRRQRTTAGQLDLLVKEGTVTPSIAQLIRQLMALRNEAAHGTSITAADAYRFRDLSDDMIDRLEQHLTMNGRRADDLPNA